MSEQSRPPGELPELLSSRTAGSAVLDGASTGVGLGSSGFTGAVKHTPAGEVAFGHGGRTNDVDKRVHHAIPSDSGAKSLRAMADQSRTGKADSRREDDDVGLFFRMNKYLFYCTHSTQWRCCAAVCQYTVWGIVLARNPCAGGNVVSYAVIALRIRACPPARSPGLCCLYSQHHSGATYIS